MRFWKKKAAEVTHKVKDGPTPDKDSHLPGTSGYSDGKRVGKGAQPTRFRFVRPDGKEEKR